MCKGYMRLYLYKIQSGVTFYLQNIHTYCYIHTAEVTIDGYQNCSMTCWCYCNATGLPDMSWQTCVTMKHFPHSWPFVRGIHRFPIYKEPVIRRFGVFFVVSLNKQSGCWWFESQWLSCDVIAMTIITPPTADVSLFSANQVWHSPTPLFPNWFPWSDYTNYSDILSSDWIPFY